jgi:hypothetical protein
MESDDTLILDMMLSEYTPKIKNTEEVVEKLITDDEVNEKDIEIIMNNDYYVDIIREIFYFFIKKFFDDLYEYEIPSNDIGVDMDVIYHFASYLLNEIETPELNYVYDKEKPNLDDINLLLKVNIRSLSLDDLSKIIPKLEIGELIGTITYIIEDYIEKKYDEMKSEEYKDAPFNEWFEIYLQDKFRGRCPCKEDEFGLWFENFRKEITQFLDEFIEFIEKIYSEMLSNILNTIEKYEYIYTKIKFGNKDLISVDYDIEDNKKLIGEYPMGSLYSSDEYEENTGALSYTYNDGKLKVWKILDDEVKLQMINDSKASRFIDEEENNYYKQAYTPYVCNNKVDTITLEEIDDKEFMKKGWIYIESPNTKVGNCYLKEDLINSMMKTAVFDWDKDQDKAGRKKKYYKLPEGLWIDKKGFDMIPTNKLLKLKFVSDEFIGSYFGVSTMHGQEPTPIYTFEKISLPPQYEQKQKKKKI